MSSNVLKDVLRHDRIDVLIDRAIDRVIGPVINVAINAVHRLSVTAGVVSPIASN